MKKIMALLLIALMAMPAAASTSSSHEIDMDEYMSSLGVPQSVIEQMTENQKHYIYSTIDPTAEYVSFDQQYYEVTDDSTLQQTRGTIDEDDLSITVTAFKGGTSDEGNDIYFIYPSFVWNVLANISNDVFGYTLFPGWEALSDEENLRLYIRNANNETTAYVDKDPIDSSYSGYVYEMDGIVPITALYEAHAYIHAEDKSGNSTHRATVKYAHDTSSSLNVSFSYNFLNGSLSISSNNDDVVEYLSGNYDFDE